jgi:hypothetical protein
MSSQNETTSETISVQQERQTVMHKLQQIKTFSDFERCCWAETMNTPNWKKSKAGTESEDTKEKKLLPTFGQVVAYFKMVWRYVVLKFIKIDDITQLQKENVKSYIDRKLLFIH